MRTLSKLILLFFMTSFALADSGNSLILPKPSNRWVTFTIHNHKIFIYCDEFDISENYACNKIGKIETESNKDDLY